MPLEAINSEAAREKSIRHGHPSTLHLWWARRPLAACRAVLFGQLVDDPSFVPEEFPTEIDQERERERLHSIIAKLVRWENSLDSAILDGAKHEIAKSTARWRIDHGKAEAIDEVVLRGKPSPHQVRQFLSEKCPPLRDPFCGGGAIPLEAQRLGLRVIASDLNPVAVLITKSLVQFPPVFAGSPPVNPEAAISSSMNTWKEAHGLAADVRHYGRLIRKLAEQRIGHLYPQALVTESMASETDYLRPYLGRRLTTIAWLWARTVRCPNPACEASMPLAQSFWLSKKKDRKIWLTPIVSGKSVRFRISTSLTSRELPQSADTGTGLLDQSGKRVQATFLCIFCGTGVARGDYIDREASAGKIGAMPLAIVAEGKRQRLYLPFERNHIEAAHEVAHQHAKTLRGKFPTEPARGTFASNAQGRVYGFKTFSDYFTERQLVTLTTLADLVREVQDQIENDAIQAGLQDDGISIEEGGSGARAYSQAVALYLSFAISRTADRSSTLCTWDSSPKMEALRNTFARQALTMTWDFAEGNPFSDSSGNWLGNVERIATCIELLPCGTEATVVQRDATKIDAIESTITTTDPPYYDNISYSDLSDYFYVWLRRSLGSNFQDLTNTMLTPKASELIATKYRERDGKKPEEFFEEGLRSAFDVIRETHHSNLPIGLFYAFKQEESDQTDGSVTSSGWDTMLTGLLKAGLSVDATWPVRTERGSRLVGLGTNALASSIVLACRPRHIDAPVTTRNELVGSLRLELPRSVKRLQEASIAPVDLAQAAIGPGMAIFSRYSKVLEPDGSSMPVRAALALINRLLDETLASEEAEYDSDTRWAITWFTQHGFNQGSYGEAEILSKARDTSVTGLGEAGIVEARAGKVRLLKREELGAWHPTADDRFTIWEACQHLIKTLEFDGEAAAARLLKQLDSRADAARDLAYRLYQHCDRKGDAEEARAYNGLVVAWPRLAALAAEEPRPVAPTLDLS